MVTKDRSPMDVLPRQTWEQRSHHFYSIYKKENGNYNERINCEVLPTWGTKLRYMKTSRRTDFNSKSKCLFVLG